VRRLLPLLFVGCAHAAPPPTTTSEAEPGLAPRPFTAEQIRAAMPAGTDLRMRVEEQGKPPAVLHWHVTAADAQGMTMSSEVLDNEDHLIARQPPQTARWDELVHHADFPAAATRQGQSRIQVPAGMYDTTDYQVRGEGGIVTTYRFAKSLPGPPILMVVEKEGLIIKSMTLLSRQ
jgi:hypothetical protein